MLRRSFQCSWVVGAFALSAVFGCAAGSESTDDLPAIDTGVDGSGSGDGAVDGSGGDTSGSGDGGDASTTDGGDDGAGDGGGDASCDPSVGLTISCGVGECTVTVPACTDAGTSATCKPKDPGTEVCNGKDDDCDGVIDEDLGDTTCGDGECRRTVKNCVDGAPKTCTPGTAGTEVCNGKDDDCDGAIDEDLGTTTCGVGECRITTNNCEAGTAKTCTPKAPGFEVCNGKDDDCDGSVDEDLGMNTCGVGECRNTVEACIGGVPVICMPKPAGIEICDGKDNDCNGAIDDGIAPLTCGVGECTTSAPACVSGSPGACVPAPPASEVCDGKDNNCNGSVDEAAIAVMCPAPAGALSTACGAVGSGVACKIAGCQATKVDVDGVYANGCECTDTSRSSSCTAAYDMGTVAVGAAKSDTMANLPSATSSAWYRVQFLNTADNKLAKPRVRFTANPADTFRFEIIHANSAGGCGGVTPFCGTDPTSKAIDRTEWYASYTTGLAGSPGQTGWTPIEVGRAPTNGVVYVRVYSRAAVPLTCSTYSIEFSN